MIDHKSKQTFPNEESITTPTKIITSTMTTSSSFTHLSLDDGTDEFSVSGEGDGDVVDVGVDEQITNNLTRNSPTASTSSTSHSFVLYDALVDICQNNIKYFECDESETGQRFLCAFSGIIDHLTIARQYVTKIITFVHEYDFDETTPANGYRSFVKTVQSCVTHCVKVSKYIAQNRSYLLFRKNMYMK